MHQGQDQDLIVADEAVRLLQLKSRSSLYSLVARGFVPAVRLGPRLLRFSREQLEVLIAGGGVKRPASGLKRRQPEQTECPPSTGSHPAERLVDARIDRIRGKRATSS